MFSILEPFTWVVHIYTNMVLNDSVFSSVMRLFWRLLAWIHAKMGVSMRSFWPRTSFLQNMTTAYGIIRIIHIHMYLCFYVNLGIRSSDILLLIFLDKIIALLANCWQVAKCNLLHSITNNGYTCMLEFSWRFEAYVNEKETIH